MLRERFAQLDCDASAFSAVHYVGTKTNQPPTDFNGIKMKVRQELDNCAVRSARSPVFVLEMLKVRDR